MKLLSSTANWLKARIRPYPLAPGSQLQSLYPNLGRGVYAKGLETFLPKRDAP